jgi:hypothetical protein
MGKVVSGALKVLAIGASIAAAAVTMGASLGISAALLSGVSLVAATGASLLAKRPDALQSSTQLGRLQARLDTQAPRKIVLGRTAMPADIRYYEGSGEDEEYVDYILAVAAHRVGSIDEIWFEDSLAWKASGGVQGEYVGYLTSVTTRLEGTAANTIAINGGARWGSDDRLTGCAYVRLRVKRSGNSDDEQSPLVSGLPGRVTIVGDGMPMYDPRFDSTAGGVGSQRIDDQATWGPTSSNPIIQALNVLLGWRINGKLSVGGGLPPKYINLDSVITAANICDEPIALAGGGTQPRYRTAGAFSTDDAPMAIVGALLAGCAGDLIDSEGQLTFLIKTNTLATPAVVFDDHDVLSAGTWDPMGGETNLANVIAGTFTDPSPNALYQPAPFPSVSLASEDGIERTAPLDLGVVENAPQAERLAKQTLQRMQYPGTWSAEYNLKAMAAKVGGIVWQTYSPRGWVNKPFRVVRQKPSRTGRIALVLREENAAIYAWEAEDTAAVQAAEPVRFDPRNAGPILLARKASETANWSRVKDDDGHRPEDDATVGAPPGTPVGDRPAEQVTGTIDTHEAQIAAAELAIVEHENQINELFDVYGDTESAAASAAAAEAAKAAAEQHELNALAAEQNSKDARDAALAAEQGATDQAGLATSERQGAEVARAATEGFRNEAFTAMEGAEDASAVASVQAGLATEARKKSNATIAGTFPEVLDPSLLNDLIAPSGSPYEVDSIEDVHPSWIDADRKSVTPEVGWNQIGLNGLFRFEEGRTYKLYADVEIVADGGQAQVRTAFYGRTLGENYESTGNLALHGSHFLDLAQGQRGILEAEYTRVGALDPSVVWWRPGILINRLTGSAGDLPGAQTRIHSLWAKDITESTRAEGSAQASQDSAVVAAAEASDAEQSASLAASERSAAETARSEAQGFRNETFTARDAAEGSAASAAASEVIVSETKNKADTALAASFPEIFDPALLGVGASSLPWDFPSFERDFPSWIAPDRLSATIPTGRYTADTRGMFPCIVGRVYELVADVEIVSEGGESGVYCGFYGRTFNEDFEYQNAQGWNNFPGGSATVPEGGRQTLTTTLNVTSGYAAYSWFRLTLLVNRMPGSTTGNPGAQTKLHALYIRDITESTDAAASATAAASSASTATTKASEAEGYSATATTQAGIAVDAKNDAEAAAGVSTSEAAVATAAASAAQHSMSVAASIGQGFLDPNAGFDDYPGSAVGSLPVGWTSWYGGSQMYRVDDPQGGYALRQPAGPGDQRGVGSAVKSPAGTIKPGDWFVLEGDLLLNSGTLSGVAVYMPIYDAAGAVVSTTVRGKFLDTFGSGMPGNVYRLRQLVQIPASWTAASRHYIAAMGHWPGGGDISAANDVTWFKCGVRPATEAEIATATTLPAVEASVSTNASAIADLDSAMASLESEVSAQGVTVSEHSTAISAVEGDVAAIAGRWGVVIDVNGNIVGRVQLDGTAETSEFSVAADSFKVTKPGGGAGMTWDVDSNGRPTLLVDDGAGSTVEIGWLS